MGELRDAALAYIEVDGKRQTFPSALLGFNDLPKNADILLNDIDEKILVKRYRKGMLVDIDILSYDEFDRLAGAGRQGKRAGQILKNKRGDK